MGKLVFLKKYGNKYSFKKIQEHCFFGGGGDYGDDVDFSECDGFPHPRRHGWCPTSTERNGDRKWGYCLPCPTSEEKEEEVRSC